MIQIVLLCDWCEIEVKGTDLFSELPPPMDEYPADWCRLIDGDDPNETCIDLCPQCVASRRRVLAEAKFAAASQLPKIHKGRK